MQIELGRAARKHWSLQPDGTFLNHGSRGACPLVVQQAQTTLRSEMENHPDLFFERIEPVHPQCTLRPVAETLANFIGLHGEQLALVESATAGVQTVLNAMPLNPGDQILFTNHQYNAVRLAIEDRCRRTGAVPVVVHLPVPTNADEILQRILDAAGPRVKLAVLDHIASATALVFPVVQLVRELQRRGIRVCIDGAHALGQLPLNLGVLGADWYVANAHKWLYAPKGSAMLHASAATAAMTSPVLVSHFIDKGFPRSFDYTGTRDYTAWLSLPAALGFFHGIGAQRLWAHNAQLVKSGSAALTAAGGVALCPDDQCAAMRSFRLPQTCTLPDDGLTLRNALWNEERIAIRAVVHDGALVLRFSAQAYVADEDLTRLGEALQKYGWPARR
jgi:isopenicillin-N epimerase